MGLMELANALSIRAPIYGLQPRGLDPREVPHTSVEVAASRYLEAVENLLARGTIHLIGHSFGGVVAFEMARRLLERGCPVASLTLIDSSLPSRAIVDVTNEEIFRDFVEAHELMFERQLAIDAGIIARGRVEPFIRSLHEALLRERLLPRGTPSELLMGSLNTLAAAKRATYHPQRPYPQDVQLITTRDPRLSPIEDENERNRIVGEWRNCIQTLDVWLVPGNHFSVLRAPHVSAVAARCLRAQER
jgi:arthrofactin-type cyclic lipopeptide synthetase C